MPERVRKSSTVVIVMAVAVVGSVSTVERDDGLFVGVVKPGTNDADAGSTVVARDYLRVRGTQSDRHRPPRPARHPGRVREAKGRSLTAPSCFRTPIISRNEQSTRETHTAAHALRLCARRCTRWLLQQCVRPPRLGDIGRADRTSRIVYPLDTLVPMRI